MASCPNPSFPLYVVIAVAAPAQAVSAFAHWQPPCQGTAIPAAGVVARASDRAGRPSSSLMSAGAAPMSCCPCGRLPPLAGAIGMIVGGRPSLQKSNKNA
ncbi:hypothetical protein B296_00036656 [Ensete ventricosum]|uniref:Secreted protein n=1 Tax=Ensete ventricosum TaxID=4639 RepID=A0A426XAI5_ENSVE|nr:hypothetical protein B296_00036656 [Ensete ventricosum]